MVSTPKALLDVVRQGYRPFQVLALGGAAIPLLQDQGLVKGHAAVYACRNFTCQAPETEPEGLPTKLG